MDSSEKVDKNFQGSRIIEVSITLPEDVVKYMEEGSYIGDYSKFIAWLIRRFQKELKKSRQEAEEYENEPNVLHEL